MKRIKHSLLTLLFGVFLSSFAFGQIANGTFCPNFEGTDINGETHNLHALLAEGYKVVIDVSATWCGPCWDYHLSGALEGLHETYGPDGTQEIFVIFIEGDDTTTMEDLEGTGSNTAGDWITATPYPIIDNAAYIGSLLEITFYPTIFTVCSDGRIYQSGTLTTQEHYDFATDMNCQAAVNDGALAVSTTNTFCEGPFTTSVDLINAGTTEMTAATVIMDGCDDCPISQDWTGTLGSFETAEITFADVNATSDIEVTFTLDVADDDLTNNEADSNVKIGFVEASTALTIELLTDCYPAESSWTVTSESGDVVASGSMYLENYTTYTETVNLSISECYTVSFYDVYGDGLNGSAFNCTSDGTFQAYTSEGTILMSDGTDTFSEISDNMMTADVVSTEDLFGTSTLSINPNPASDLLNITLTDIDVSELTVQILDVTGRMVHTTNYGINSNSFQQQVDVSALNTGMYFVNIISNESQLSRKVIIE